MTICKNVQTQTCMVCYIMERYALLRDILCEITIVLLPLTE